MALVSGFLITLLGCGGDDGTSDSCEPKYSPGTSDELWRALVDESPNETTDPDRGVIVDSPAEGDATSDAVDLSWHLATGDLTEPTGGCASGVSFLKGNLGPESLHLEHCPPFSGNIYWVQIDVPGEDCPVSLLTAQTSLSLDGTDLERVTATPGTRTGTIRNAFVMGNVIIEGPFVTDFSFEVQ